MAYRSLVHSSRSRLHGVAAVVFSLGVLACFKYAAFLVESILPILRFASDAQVPVPHILLPLGISFFT